MSPHSGQMLTQEIAPRLRAVIPKSVHPIGGEDAEELVQDAIVFAAQMLDRIEKAGKTVFAGNIAYYAILQMRGGRRSQSSTRAWSPDADLGRVDLQRAALRCTHISPA